MMSRGRASRDDEEEENGERLADEYPLVEQLRAVLRRMGEMAPESWRRTQREVVDSLVGESCRLAKLSEREQEVWQLWCEGYSAKEIAGRLVLSENTVNTHLQHIRRKLEMCDIEEVVMRRHGRE